MADTALNILLNRTWEKNCQFLKDNNYNLYLQFINNDYNFQKSVNFEKTRKGFINASFKRDDEKFKPLHSKFDPVSEAARFIKSQNIESNNNLLILGLGLGYHFFEILNRRDLPDWITIIEEDLRSFWAFCHIHDIEFLYNTKGLYFLLTPSENDIFPFLIPHIFNIIANGLQTIRHNASFQEAKCYYQTLEQKVNDFSIWAKANIMTQVRANNIFSKNILTNLESKITAIPFKNFQNIFENIPCIIVSGGPSLTKNGYLLKKVKGKALIIAVDTSLRFLSKHKIEPDFIVSTDFTKNAEKHFEDFENKNSLLLVDDEVYPEVIKTFPGKVTFCDIEGKSLCEWLKKIIGNFGSIPKGVSVSHTAFSAAIYLKASPIILIGQDLAFTNNRTHVKGATHGVHILADESYLTVKGLFGPVKTSKSLKVFLNHFEEIISDHSNKVIDATEGGALIKGTEVKTFREVILEKISPLPLIITKKIQKVVNKKEKKPVSFTKIKKFLLKIDEEIVDLHNLSLDLKYDMEKLFSSFQEVDKDFIIDYEKFKNKTQKLILFLPVLEILRDSLTEAFIVKSKKFKCNLTNINKESDKIEIKKLLQSEIMYYNHLASTTKIISEQIHDTIFLK